MKSNQANIFQKGKELFYVIIIFVVMLLFLEIFLRVVYYHVEGKKSCAIIGASEKINEFLFSHDKPEVSPKGATRFVRLREQYPFYDNNVIPSSDYLEKCDSLEKIPYSIRIDSDGYIKPSVVCKNPDLKIFFLGGSTTECLYVTENKRFPYLVGKRISEDLDICVNSYNSGRGGNHSMHSIIILLSKVLPERPDIVVLMHNLNDLNTLYMEGSYWNDNPFRSMLIDPRSDREVDFDDEFFLKGRAIKKYRERQNDIIASFRNSLETFIEICKSWGITPVLMTQANRISKDPDPVIHRGLLKRLKLHGEVYEDYYNIYHEMNQTARSVAENKEIQLIDLDRKGLNNKTNIYDAVHLNDNGSISVAEIISDSLKDVVKAKIFKNK